MKVLKIIAAVLLSVALIVAGSAAMGVFSIDRAVSEDSVSKAVKETGIVQELTDEVISENTVNMGGEYGEVIKAAMDTDAMNAFFSSYISSSVRSEIYGEEHEEIGSDELMNAFSSAIDELRASGQTDITSEEEEIIRTAILQEIADLTDSINEKTYFDTTELTEGQDEGLPGIFTQTGMKLLTAAVSIVLCALLIALFWRSKVGFIWCAVVFGITALIYKCLSMIGGGDIIDVTSGSISEKFVITLLAEGFSDVAIAGFVIMILFIIAYIPLKIRDRRRD